MSGDSFFPPKSSSLIENSPKLEQVETRLTCKLLDIGFNCIPRLNRKWIIAKNKILCEIFIYIWMFAFKLYKIQQKFIWKT